MALLVNSFAQQGDRLRRAKADAAITHGTFAARRGGSLLQGNIFHGTKRYAFFASDTPVSVNFQLVGICFCLISKK